jgi:hypothetical protein
MAKDPAFLFYSQQFYESTRLMFPEERACYLDLLIYQHQNGSIPLDNSRIHLYCTGVSNEVVNQVLNQKFNQTDEGWVNKKMEGVINERKIGNPKKRAYGTLAGLLSANNLSDEEKKIVKKSFNVDDYIQLDPNQIKEEIKCWFYNLVNSFVNNNKDKDKDKSKDIVNTKTKVFKIPTVKEIKEFCQERENRIDSQKFHDFYQGKGWMIGKNKMKDWKACVRTWERNDSSNGNSTQANTEDDNR